jgi:hypothetical protein
MSLKAGEANPTRTPLIAESGIKERWGSRAAAPHLLNFWACYHSGEKRQDFFQGNQPKKNAFGIRTLPNDVP